ncbi:MAG: CoA transferase [Desulfobacteraceae bacterium]|nr:CoA transferase [Desulfobacteraceae bacterium]
MPLSGIKVVDLTRMLSGPFCTMLLGDMGAEIIKIETPGKGDATRAQGVIKDGLSWYFAAFNRNKKSITLNLRSKEGQDILTRLIRQSDVVVENFRPTVMAKMGFDYPRLKEIKPEIIYCGISGFGADGPHAHRPAFDFIAQAMSGLMSLNGREGEAPLRMAPPISDLVAGLYGAFGIAAALVRRAQTGEGEEVRTSLLDGLISFMGYMSANYFASGELPKRTGNDHPMLAPYGLFRAADGEVAIAPSSEETYQRFLTALDLTHLNDDSELATNDLRMSNRAKVNALVEEKIRVKPKAYWIERLNKAGVPTGTIQDLKGVFEDPQVLHQEMVTEVEHPGYGKVKMTGFPVKMCNNPCRVSLPAPKLGEHTKKVLIQLGIGESQLKKLRAEGVI